MASYRPNEATKRVIDETKRLYSNLLTRALDEKQLTRPTFSFIQSLVKSIITETRTLRNVFNPSDFDTESKSWDKRRKTEFIQRLIDFAANHKQPVVGCVAAKLVAGLEPSKTNELLQSLAKIAQARLSGQEANDPKRPRTFTRQLPGSALSSRDQPSGNTANKGLVSQQQLQSSRRSSRDSPSQATGSHKVKAFTVRPPERTQGKPKASTTNLSNQGSKVHQQRLVAREVSAGSSFVGSRRTSTQSSIESATVGNRTQMSTASSAKHSVDSNQELPVSESRSRAPSESGRSDPIVGNKSAEKQPKQAVASRLTSVISKTPTSTSLVISESHINIHIQQLRSNLEALRSGLLVEVCEFETKLKLKLTEQLDRHPAPVQLSH